VPCTIKESFSLAGMPNSSGLVARAGLRAGADATAVARLRRAGAIPVGVTNVSELCMWMESDNRVYGRTRNPYDPRRIVGGSSGGEGAVVAAAGVPFGLGSDVGGSIRMPAFFNGVFGHKPTGGLIPNSGQFPATDGGSRYLTSGPLCRRAEDLWPLVQLLAGPDGIDSGCTAFVLGDPAKVELSKLRVYTIESNGFVKVAPALVTAQRQAAAALGKLGARVETLEIPLLKQSLGIWSSMLAEIGGPTFGEMLGNGKPISNGLEVLRLLFGRSAHTVPAVGLAILNDLVDKLPGQTEKFLALGRELRVELDRMLDKDSVLLYPSYTRPAPPHNQPLYMPVQWVYTAIWNVMEVPATQVPLGLDVEGLPLGVQVIGRWGYDHLTIAVAQALERAFGGWVPPRIARG
jgi:fatty acid amide hydrolase 2